MLDSGAFQEIRKYGRYTYSIGEYFSYCLKYNPSFFVSMDYMCEPTQLKKSGMSVKQHQ